MSTPGNLEAHYDAVIVGAGHNGLVCGAYLARAGKRVCLLERRSQPGGAAVSEALWPGYRVSTASYTQALLQPRIIQDLELARHGYEVIAPTPMMHVFAPGEFLIFREPLERLQQDLARYSARDAAAYPVYRDHMRALGQAVSQLLWEVPVDPADSSLSGRLRLMRLAWRYRNLGPRFHALYDAMTLSAYDFLRRWFESDAVITALGFYASCGGATTSIGMPGSAYILLRGFVRDHGTPAGPAGFIRGGMGTISDAIAESGRQHGMQVHCDAEVAGIDVRDGKACGVVLADGRRVGARAVISNIPTKLLFADLLPDHARPAALARRVQSIRDASTAFKVHLALDRLPTFSGFRPEQEGFGYPAQLRIGPSVQALDAAFDASRAGRMADVPPLVVTTPSVMDDTVAPPGKHLMIVFGQHAPYHLQGGWTDAARDQLLDTVLRTLSAYAPDLPACIAHRHVLTPADLERIFRLPGGHVHHGELSADQVFFNRPAPGLGDYRTHLGGLYQCGASTHPGGGVTGVPGHNAAHVVLADRGC